MPSMSYCKFENLYEDMRQVLDSLYEANRVEALELSEHEELAFDMLYVQCSNFIDEYRRLTRKRI
jgi:hypothetical protein